MASKKGSSGLFRGILYALMISGTVVFSLAYLQIRDPGMIVLAGITFIPIALSLLIKAIKQFRKDRRWSVGIISKALLGLVPSVVFVGLSFIALAYSSGCKDRIAPSATLVGCNFSKADLNGANLSQANLSSVDLKEANLQKANLAGANLTLAVLHGAQLQKANLAGANLTKAQLNGADVTDVALDEAILDGARLMGVIGLNDEKLATILKSTSGTLASHLSKKDIRLESRPSILSGLKNACRGEGIDQAANYNANDSFHPIVVLNTQGERFEWTDQIPIAWEPMALRFVELVACTQGEQRQIIQTCSYTGGSAFTRSQYIIDLRIIAAKTGQVVAQRTFSGTTPDRCPEVKGRFDGSGTTGGPVNRDEVNAWLIDIVHPAP